MRKTVSVGALRFALGLFFVVLGVEGVLPDVQESIFTLSDWDLTLELVFGIVEIACGVLLILGLAMRKGSSAIRFASVLVLLLWLVRVVLTRFVWGLRIGGGTVRFAPEFPVWLMVLAAELVVAAGLFVIARAYE